MGALVAHLNEYAAARTEGRVNVIRARLRADAVIVVRSPEFEKPKVLSVPDLERILLARDRRAIVALVEELKTQVDEYIMEWRKDLSWVQCRDALRRLVRVHGVEMVAVLLDEILEHQPANSRKIISAGSKGGGGSS